MIDEDNLKAIYNAKEKLKTDDFRCVPLTQGELWNEGVAGEETKQAEITGSEFIGKYKGNKWGRKYLRAPDIFFTILEKGKGELIEFSRLYRIGRGVRTGINEFFYLNEKKIREHKIDNTFLHPLLKSPKEAKNNILIDEENLKIKLFYCNLPKKALSRETLDYIEYGEKNDWNTKNTIGKFWYSLDKLKKYKIIFPFQVWLTHEYFYSRDGVFIDQTLNGIDSKIASKDEDNYDFLCSYLNSTANFLLTELYGESQLGEGSLAVASREIKMLPILNVFNLKSDYKERLKKSFSLLLKRNIKDIFQEIGLTPSKPIREQEPNPLPDRKELDDTVFDILGLTKAERKEVYWAVCELVKQRMEKARSLKKS